MPYLSPAEIQNLEKLKSTPIRSIRYHYWQQDTFVSFDWLEIGMEDESIAIEAGNLAENIQVTAFDLTELRKRIDQTYNLAEGYDDEPIVIITKDKSDATEWGAFINQKLTDIQLMDYKGYCHNSVILSTVDARVEIIAGLDNVDIIFDENKIGRWF